MVAYVAVILLAMVPQVTFTVLYWKWIPAWRKNSYGVLSQLDSWAQIVLLGVLMFFLVTGTHLAVSDKRLIMTFCIVPMIGLSFFRLFLLKRAVDSSRAETTAKEEGKQ